MAEAEDNLEDVLLSQSRERALAFLSNAANGIEPSDFLATVVSKTSMDLGFAAEAALERGAKPLDKYVFRACRHGQTRVLRALLSGGGNPSACNERGFSALYSAAEFKNVACMKMLLEAGANVYCKIDRKNASALYEVSRNGHVQIVRELLKYGTDPNVTHMPFSVLYVACEFGHNEVIKMLLEHGADPNVGNPRSRLQCLGVAVAKGFTHTAKLLLDAKADPTVLHKGRTPLSLAVQAENQELVFLLEKAQRTGGFDDPQGVAFVNDDSELRGVDRSKHGSSSTGARYILEGSCILACGDNSSGQLGMGDKTTRDRLTVNVELSNVIIRKVACGANFFFSLTGEGAVFACGRNNKGQLGLGTTVDATSPALVTALKEVVITDVSCGDLHSVWLNSAGKVLTAGDGSCGQLGHGVFDGSLFPKEIFQLSGKTMKAVSAGWYHTGCLTRTGEVFTWGENSEGQLGIGSTKSKCYPRMVGVNHQAVAVLACGGSLSVLCTVNGKVLQAGSSGKSHVFEDVDIGGETAIDVAAGGHHALCLTAGGEVLAWGRNSCGQCGCDPDESTFLPKATVVECLRGLFVSGVFSGSYHVLAVVAGGVLAAWGFNKHGQLAAGDQDSRGTPTLVNVPDGHGHVEAVAAGNSFSVFLFEDGAVYVAGKNEFGQLGIDATEDAIPNMTSCKPLASPTYTLAASPTHVLAASDDGVIVFGENDDFQLGLGTNSTVDVMIPTPTKVLSGLPVRLVGCGHAHSVAVVGAHHLYTWGASKTQYYPTTWSKEPTLVDSWTLPVAGLACGAFHTVLQTDIGAVYGFGDNSKKQLSKMTLEVCLPKKAQAIACGPNFTVIIHENGDIYSFGQGDNGQLGIPPRLGGNTAPTPVVNVPTHAPCPSARNVACGNAITFVITKENELYYAGKLHSEPVISPLFRKLPMPDGEVPFRVSCGAAHACVVTNSGKLYTWGSNKRGSLGLGDRKDRPTPTLVPLRSKGAVSVVAAGDATYVTVGSSRVIVDSYPVEKMPFYIAIESVPRHINIAETLAKVKGVADVATVPRTPTSKAALLRLTDPGALQAVTDAYGGVFKEAVEVSFEEVGGIFKEQGSTAAQAEKKQGSEDTSKPETKQQHGDTKTQEDKKEEGEESTEKEKEQKRGDTGTQEDKKEEGEESTEKKEEQKRGVPRDLLRKHAFLCLESGILQRTAAHMSGQEWRSQLAVIRPCIACLQRTTQGCLPWHAPEAVHTNARVAPLLFDRSILYAQNRDTFHAPGLVCGECSRQLASQHGFINIDACRETCRETVEVIVEAVMRTGKTFFDCTWFAEATLWNTALSRHRVGDPDNIIFPTRFRRIGGIVRNPRFAGVDVDPGDVEQGGIGTCYLLGSLSVMATRAGMIDELLFACYPDEGVFAVRFADYGCWKFVLVDDYIACGQSFLPFEGAKPVYGWCKDVDFLDIMIIEKAYAKFKGSYEAIDGGIDRYAMVDLTGGVCDSLDFKLPQIARTLETGAFWETIVEYLHAGKLMSCSINIPGLDSEHKMENGLLAGHAYAITGAIVVGNTRLLRIRNPHGNTGWSGAYATIREEVLGRAVENDGEFFISYSDFTQAFNSVDVTTVVRSNDAAKAGMEQVASFSGTTLLDEPAFYVSVPQDDTSVVVEFQQNTGLPAGFLGHEIALLVCLWREGAHFSPGDGGHTPPRVYADLRTASVVDRVFPTRDVNVSLELCLWPQSGYGHFLLPSSTGHSDFPWVMNVYSSDPSTKVMEAVVCTVHSDSTWSSSSYWDEEDYADDEEEDVGGDDGADGPAGASFTKKAAERTGRNVAARRGRKTTARRGRRIQARKGRRAGVRRGRRTGVRRNARKVDHRTDDTPDVSETAPQREPTPLAAAVEDPKPKPPPALTRPCPPATRPEGTGKRGGRSTGRPAPMNAAALSPLKNARQTLPMQESGGRHDGADPSLEILAQLLAQLAEKDRQVAEKDRQLAALTERLADTLDKRSGKGATSTTQQPGQGARSANEPGLRGGPTKLPQIRDQKSTTSIGSRVPRNRK